VKLNAASAGDFVTLHHVPPLSTPHDDEAS
jgi:hypothetical protein